MTSAATGFFAATFVRRFVCASIMAVKKTAILIVKAIDLIRLMMRNGLSTVGLDEANRGKV